MGTRILLGIALLLAALAAGGWWWLGHANRYTVDGELALPGLDAPVTVLRDRYGIPYIFAENDADLFRAQGFVTAQHRLLQMLAYRALITGRLAEAIGEDGLESDKAMRVLGLARNARRHAAILEPESRAMLEHYAEGINAYLEHHADEHPLELRLAPFPDEPWTLADMVAVLHFVHFLQGSLFRSELAMQAIIDALGPEAARAYFPRNVHPERDTPQRLGLRGADLLFDPAALGPDAQFGSNNWAVSAARSVSGGAVLANDPHLDARTLPGVWHPVGLFSPDIQAVGAALPGLPGLLVGRTRHVAFGVTNAYGDTQDLYIETVDPEDSGRYLDGGESLPFGVREEIIRVRDSRAAGGFREEVLTVRSTRRGPVLTGHGVGRDAQSMLSLRSVPAEAPGTRTGLRAMLAARDVAGFDAAVQHMTVFLFNFVFADTAGDVGFRATGRVPVRASGHGLHPKPAGDDWLGYIDPADMPGRLRPARGWVATANHDTRPEGYAHHYSSYFSPPYRYETIARHLDTMAQGDVEDHLALMLNVENAQAARLVPVLVEVLESDPAHAELAALLAEWDLRDTTDSAAPTLYQAIYRRLVRRYYTDALGEVLADEWLADWYRWQSLFDAEVERARADAAHPLRALIPEAATDAHRALQSRFGKAPERWSWGRAHSIAFFSPLRPGRSGWPGGGTHPYPGSGETVQRARTAFGDEAFDTVFHASMRLIADLADDEKVMAVVSGGVSERHRRPHRRDQLRVWLRGELIPWWFDPGAVEQHAHQRITLQPAEASVGR